MRIIYCIIHPIRTELHDCRVGHLLIMPNVIGRLDIGSEDVVRLQRCKPGITFIFQKLVHVQPELGKGIACFNRGKQLFIEAFQNLKLCIAADRKCQSLVFLG